MVVATKKPTYKELLRGDVNDLTRPTQKELLEGNINELSPIRFSTTPQPALQNDPNDIFINQPAPKPTQQKPEQFADVYSPFDVWAAPPDSEIWKSPGADFVRGFGQGWMKQTQVPALMGRKLPPPTTTAEKIGEGAGRMMEVITEFIGLGMAMRGVGLLSKAIPKGAWAGRALQTGALFGTQQITEEARKATAEAIYGEDFGSRGGIAVLESFALGVVLSLAGSGVGKVWSKLKPSEQAMALKTLGLKKGASLYDINKAARREAFKFHPDKVKGMRQQFDKVIRARDALRRAKAGDIIKASSKQNFKKQLMGKTGVSSKVADTAIRRLDAGESVEKVDQMISQAKAGIKPLVTAPTIPELAPEPMPKPITPKKAVEVPTPQKIKPEQIIRRPEGTIDVDLPPVKEGYIRLYRGQHPTTQKDLFHPKRGVLTDKEIQELGLSKGKGGWFTPWLNYALNYAEAQGKGYEIVYIDVPRTVADAHIAEKAPEGLAERGEAMEYYFPELREAKPVAGRKAEIAPVAKQLRTEIADLESSRKNKLGGFVPNQKAIDIQIEELRRKLAEVTTPSDTLEIMMKRWNDYFPKPSAEEAKMVSRTTGKTVAQERKEFAQAIIEQAVREGKPVPAEVLAEYPDLAPVTQPEAAKVEKADIVEYLKLKEDFSAMRFKVVSPEMTQLAKLERSLMAAGILKTEETFKAPSDLKEKMISRLAKPEAVEVADMTLDALKQESATFDKKIETEIARLDKIAPKRQRFAETGIEHLSQEDASRMVAINDEIGRRTGISQVEAKKRVAEKRAARAAKPVAVRKAEIAPVAKPEAKYEVGTDIWYTHKGKIISARIVGAKPMPATETMKADYLYEISPFESPKKTISIYESQAEIEVQPIAPVTQPEAAKVEKPKPKIVKPTGMATQGQKAQAHIIAKRKGFISEKGKMRPGYRALAKAMTGQTSIAKMIEQQAKSFINALSRLPEPTIIGGKIIPPSIPRTAKLVPKGFAQRRFKRPTPISLITSNAYYAEKLGVKSLVEPLEKAKMRFDLEHHSASNELDKMGQKIDVLGKTTVKEKITAKVRNIPTKARAEMGDLLDKYEEAPANLDPKKKEIFDWFRNLSRTMLARQNEARAKLDLPLIKKRKAYMRHIATDISREMLAGKYPFPEGIGFWSGLNVGKKIFNPMEFQRKLEDDVYGLFTRDPVYASKAMMYNALKEIHLNQPLKFFNEQLSALGKDLPEYKNLSPRERAELDKTSVMPADTRRWLIDYVRTVIKGQQTNTDTLVNNIVNESGLRGLLNTALRPFGRTLSQRPVTKFFQGAGRVQMAGVMGPRPRLLIRNKFQLTQNLALYGTKANVRAFLPPSKELKKLLDESLFLKSYTGLEELPADLAKKVEKLWHTAYQWTASSNARQAMEVAYWDIKELIENPKYAKYGWKPEHLLKEMEFGASATQYQYNAIGMPGIFRHKSLIPATRLTSWWMNYFAKFHREALHRAFTGRPSWSGPDGPTLPWSRRLGWLRYAVLGGLILNTMGYTRSYMFGAAPTGWPPAMQAASALYRYTIADDDAKRKVAKTRFYNAAKTFIPGYIAYKDFNAIWTGRKDLESLFFYQKRKKKNDNSD